MKQTAIIFAAILTLGTTMDIYAADQDHPMHHMAQHQALPSADDGRISLNLPPRMKQHQLSNMRSHLEALQAIIGYLAGDEYEKAPQVAHHKLGLTPEMKQMCNMFGNDDFRELGFAFHRSGDELGDTLKTGDKKRSLLALQTTMGYCGNAMRHTDNSA